MRLNGYTRRAKAATAPVAILGNPWDFTALTVIQATELLTVFVNERPVRVPPAATGLDAVRALDPELARELAEGRAYLTDGRGIRTGAGEPITAGAILRAVISARQTQDADADA
jgi:hypothetical protein